MTVPLIPLPRFAGVKRRFPAKRVKYSNLRIIKTAAAIPTKFYTIISTSKYSTRLVSKCAPCYSNTTGRGECGSMCPLKHEQARRETQQWVMRRLPTADSIVEIGRKSRSWIKYKSKMTDGRHLEKNEKSLPYVSAIVWLILTIDTSCDLFPHKDVLIGSWVKTASHLWVKSKKKFEGVNKHFLKPNTQNIQICILSKLQ